MTLVLTETDMDNRRETDVDSWRRTLAVLLLHAHKIGARVIDLDPDREPVLLAWSASQIIKFEPDPPCHLVSMLLPFALNDFTELVGSHGERAAVGPGKNTIVTRWRHGEAHWKYWHDSYRRIQFSRTTPMGPSEKLVSWGRHGERCCNAVLLRNEIEQWISKVRNGGSA